MYGDTVVTAVTLAITGNGSTVAYFAPQRGNSAGTAHGAPPDGPLEMVLLTPPQHTPDPSGNGRDAWGHGGSQM